MAVIAVLALIVLGKSLIAFGIVLLLRYPVGMGLRFPQAWRRSASSRSSWSASGCPWDCCRPRDAISCFRRDPVDHVEPRRLHGGGRDPQTSAGKAAGGCPPYGQQRFEAFQHNLAEARRRGEEREKARNLEIRALAETFPVLSMLGAQDQESLLLLFYPRSASPGDRVIRRGDRASEMYFISSGAVEVLAEGRTIRLEAGTLFGEMALLSGKRRSADVTAVDYCQFLVLDRRDFNRFTASHPALRTAFIDMANQRRKKQPAGIGRGSRSI